MKGTGTVSELRLTRDEVIAGLSIALIVFALSVAAAMVLALLMTAVRK